MKSFKTSFAAFLALVLSVGAGSVWYLYQEENLPAPSQTEELSWHSARAEYEYDFAAPPSEYPFAQSGPADQADADEPFHWPEGAVPGDVVLRFATGNELQEFMRAARRAGLEVDAIPALGTVRVRTRGDEQLRRALALGKNAEASFNPSVAAPEVPPLDGVAERFRPFGGEALAWMGVPDQNADWGKGLTIAILDTGVGEHPSLAEASITRMSMLEGAASLEYGSHGMAVASLLVGQGDVKGIVPAADILSIQVLDAAGQGNGFDLARGIMAAVDGGADIINLSLGTPTHSQALWEAVMYAHARDIVVVASPGNDGGGRLLFPAGYAGVVSVASVDANGQHMPFSNRGEGLAVAAPGFSLTTAAPDGGTIYSSGTSFSGPLVAGAVASLMAEMSPWEAVEAIKNYSNDAGPLGPDGYYGEGVIDMERVLARGTPGVYDIAVADHYFDKSGDRPEMFVTVENRGTETIGGISLEVWINGELQTHSIGSLAAGEGAASTIFLGEAFRMSDSVKVVSRVSNSGSEDVRPDNDGKASTLWIRSPEE